MFIIFPSAQVPASLDSRHRFYAMKPWSGGVTAAAYSSFKPPRNWLPNSSRANVCVYRRKCAEHRVTVIIYRTKSE